MKKNKKYNSEGMRMTDCCGVYSTFVEETLCCKKCFREVPIGQGDGNEYRMTPTQRKTKLQRAQNELEKRKHWMTSHGLTVEEYIKRYGIPNTSKCYGMGGKVIWAADVSALIEAFAHASGRSKITTEDIVEGLTFVMGVDNPLRNKSKNHEQYTYR